MSKKEYKIGDIVYRKDIAKKGRLEKITIHAVLQAEVTKEEEIIAQRYVELSPNDNWLTKCFKLIRNKKHNKKIKVKSKKQIFYFSRDVEEFCTSLGSFYYFISNSYSGISESFNMLPLQMKDFCTKEKAEKLICKYWENKKKETLKEIDCKINKYCKED